MTSLAEVSRDEAGRAVRLVGALADVTDASRGGEARPPAAAGELTRGIAHDFNNLLGVIVGNLELLLEQTTVDPSTRRLVDRAIRSARQGVELTKRLVAL